VGRSSTAVPPLAFVLAALTVAIHALVDGLNILYGLGTAGPPCPLNSDRPSCRGALHNSIVSWLPNCVGFSCGQRHVLLARRRVESEFFNRIGRQRLFAHC